MQTVSSYGVEIRKQNIPIRQTLEIYRQAVSYLTEIYEQVWAELKMIPEAKKRFNAGTFASSKDLSVAGRGFKSSLIKYLAPIL